MVWGCKLKLLHASLVVHCGVVIAVAHWFLFVIATFLNSESKCKAPPTRCTSEGFWPCCHVFSIFNKPLCLGLSVTKQRTVTYNNCKATKRWIVKSSECSLSNFLCLIAIVTTRRTEHRETEGRKPLSSKMRKKLSRRRASRSHKQQKPQPPPHGNAVEQQPARLWTWVLQPTTLETTAQRRRYAHKHAHVSKCEIHFQ